MDVDAGPYADPFPPAAPAAEPPTSGGEHTRNWAVTMSLLGGVLILAGSFLLAILLTFLSFFGAWPATWGLEDPGRLTRAAFFVAFWGLVTGGLVLYSAAVLRKVDESALVPGIGLVAGGLLSFFAMGGFIVGGLLAIVAGVLAIGGMPPMAFERAPRWRALGRV